MGWSWPFAGGTPSTNRGDGQQTHNAQTERQKREEQADAELDEFLQSFAAPQPKTVAAPMPAIGGVAPPIKQVKEEKEDEHDSLADGRRVFDDGTVDIRPELLHPRSMNCRQAFDQAFYCQSLGGKFNDIYRYGHFQSCSEQWNAFWFCMRTRTLGDDEKARQTAEYYTKRDAKRCKEFGSSEDVWDLRTRSVERAFWKNPDNTAGEHDVKD